MLAIWQSFKQNYLIKYWNPVAAVIAAGIISAYYFSLLFRHYWHLLGGYRGIYPLGRSSVKCFGC